MKAWKSVFWATTSVLLYALQRYDSSLIHTGNHYFVCTCESVRQATYITLIDCTAH